LLESLVLRFIIGGAVVSAFALLGDIFRPRNFAGLFGAAPSVALASITLTVHREGVEFATVEAHSMIFGAIALLLCAYALSQLVVRFQLGNLAIASIIYGVWLISGAIFWGAFLK
jgi:hypothetical protein